MKPKSFYNCFYAILALLIPIFLFSCRKSSNSPVRTISITGLQCKGYPLTFHYNGPTASSFSWDFGDSSHSSEPSPTHIYGSNDSFKITLIVNNSQANPITITIYINIAPQLVDSGTAVVNNPIYFKSEFASATTFVWDFGDGIQSSLAQPNHSYTSTGTFYVSLTFDNNSSDTVGKFITVYPTPLYTNLLGGTKTWTHTHYDEYSSGITDSAVSTTSFAINYINNLAISIGTITYTYNPILSNDTNQVYFYYFNNEPGIPEWGNYTLYFNHTNNHISIYNTIRDNLGYSYSDVYTNY